MAAPPRRGWKPYGQIVPLQIASVGPAGHGEATYEGHRYEVATAVPGDRVEARIFKRHKGVRRAALERVTQPSAERVPAPCPAFGTCGGCMWQSWDYPAQAAALERGVRDLSGLPEEVWAEVIAADNPYLYRGKIELTFGGVPGEVVLGFNERGRFDRIVPLERCHIGPPVNAAIIERVRRWASASGHAPYDQRKHAGFLRYLVIRQASTEVGALREDDPWLAALVTSAPGGAEGLVEALADVPNGSVLQVVSASPAGAVRVDELHVLSGPGRLDATLGGVRYALSFASFFQSNQRMAERLVAVVRARAALTGVERVLDLFCGVGTIALALAGDAAEVVGVEYVADAVRDAAENAARNQITNARFEQGEAERYEWGEVDLVILDPPRSGLHPRLVRRLVEQPPPRIIYVSCNPRALAQDLETLRGIYRVTFAQCVDLFPQTPHVETVVELKAASLNVCDT